MDKPLLPKRIWRLIRETIKNEEMNKYTNKPYVTEINKSKQFDSQDQLNLAAIEKNFQL